MNKKALKMLFLSLLIGIAIYIEKPILPAFLAERGIAVEWSGYLFAVFGLAVMFFAPFLGDVGDKKSRKMVFVISVIGMGIAQFFFVSSKNTVGLLLSRFMFGTFFSGVAVNFMAYFNDNYEGSTKSKMISYNLAIATLGLAIGSLIGGYLGSMTSINNIFYVQAVLLVSLSYLIYTMYPKETIRIDIKRQYVFNLIQNIKRVRVTGLLPGMFITMVFTIGVHITMNFLEFYLTDISFNLSQIGLFVFVLSLIGVIGNFFITPRLLKRYDEKLYLVVILFISGVSLILTGIYGFGIYSFLMLFSLVQMMFKPITTQLISHDAGEEQGLALGVRETLIHFGMIVGSLIGGYLISVNSIYIFYVSALIMFLCSIGFGTLKYLEIRK